MLELGSYGSFFACYSSLSFELSTPTPSSDRDSMIWKFISSRQFTVKTGQLWFSRSITVDKDRAWNTIWQWQGPQRVRTFLWLGYHERILTNVERARRHLSASNNCRSAMVELRQFFMLSGTFQGLIMYGANWFPELGNLVPSQALLALRIGWSRTYKMLINSWDPLVACFWTELQETLAEQKCYDLQQQISKPRYVPSSHVKWSILEH